MEDREKVKLLIECAMCEILPRDEVRLEIRRILNVWRNNEPDDEGAE